MKIHRRFSICMIIGAMDILATKNLLNSIDSFIREVKAEVLRVEPKCTNLVTTAQSLFVNALIASSAVSFGNSDKLETYFVGNLSQNSTAVSPWSPAPFWHFKPCSLLLLDISPLIRQADNYSLDYNNWPTVPYAGSLHTSYYLFFVDTPDEIPDGDESLLSFGRTTRKLQNAFIIVYSQQRELNIFARSVFADRLTLISTYSTSESFTQEARSFLKFKVDFEGAPMIATVCPICDNTREIFERTGEWSDYLTATMYELACYANATLEPTAVFGAPQTGLTLEGDWDVYVMPLIDGSGVITQLLEPSAYNIKFVFPSSPTFFDSVAFITDRPKRLRFTSLSRLVAPLRLNVWIALGLSFIFVFIALEIIIQVYRELQFERRARSLRKAAHVLSTIEKSLIWEAIPDHCQHWTAFALISSALEQCAIFSGAFSKNINGHASRLLFSLWYLMLIVVGCMYKSDLTSLIVRPVYIKPPATFMELIESDYKIGAIVWSGNLEGIFKAANNTVSRKILPQVYEYEFLEPDVSLLTQRILKDLHLRCSQCFSSAMCRS